MTVTKSIKQTGALGAWYWTVGQSRPRQTIRTIAAACCSRNVRLAGSHRGQIVIMSDVKLAKPAREGVQAAATGPRGGPPARAGHPY